MPFEDDLGAALRSTGDSFSTDNRALVAAGLAQGRSARRRRTAAVAGTVAAVAAVGVTAALVAPGGSAGDTGPSAPSGPQATHGSAEDFGATPEEKKLLRLFGGLLPKGGFLSGRAVGPQDDPRARPSSFAEVVWDDGHGASTISVGLDLADQSGQDLTECPDLALMKQGTTCRRSELPDRSVLVVIKTWEYQDEREGPENWQAILTTPDGRRIWANEWNAPEEKAKETSRDDPPLDVAQLTALVRAPRWNSVFDAFPASSGAPSGASGSVEPRGTEILKRLKAVMPAGLKITAPVGEDGYAHITVDDGHGPTLVEVNVQHWAEEDFGDLQFSDPQTLPDGTKVQTTQGAGDKGGAGIQQWTADTLRPDGLRVVISELNSGGYHRPPTRTTPALGMDALVKAATDPRWKSLG
ncbi:hypothetical protein PV350_17675 [Streptomyces sp. PA03-6a]|nr:hypothetical protein [Streptomyces sp. PA03-6a]